MEGLIGALAIGVFYVCSRYLDKGYDTVVGIFILFLVPLTVAAIVLAVHLSRYKRAERERAASSATEREA